MHDRIHAGAFAKSLPMSEVCSVARASGVRPVGKSGVNHRLRKLEKMAAELEEKQQEEETKLSN